MKRPDRAVRKAAADALTDGLKEQERTLVTIYNTLLADKKLEDRLRKYEYPEQARHLSNELDKETVDVVDGMCKSRSDIVARYYRTKRDIIGLPELTHYDRYCPLFDAEQEVSWEESRNIILDSFEAFDPLFRKLAEEFYDNNWIDAEIRPGKCGGAFCSGITPDTHPVILVNYLGKLDDVTTVAHELGHGIHSTLGHEQTYFNCCGTLPMAELASIFAEMLVFESVVANANLKDKIALYAHKIEMIFASVFRQAAMFRFEQRCHALRRTQGEITPEQFGDIWQDEIQAMFEDSVTIGEQQRNWWSYITHFIAVPFYVYAYTFGELLTLSIFQMAKGQGSEFREKYIQVLRKGGSISPHELMEIIGVDLKAKEFWLRGFEVIESMVAEFERLWKEYKATL
jgi:oligoendopeptidase F